MFSHLFVLYVQFSSRCTFKSLNIALNVIFLKKISFQFFVYVVVLFKVMVPFQLQSLIKVARARLCCLKCMFSGAMSSALRVALI